VRELTCSVPISESFADGFSYFCPIRPYSRPRCGCRCASAHSGRRKRDPRPRNRRCGRRGVSLIGGQYDPHPSVHARLESALADQTRARSLARLVLAWWSARRCLPPFRDVSRTAPWGWRNPRSCRSWADGLLAHARPFRPRWLPAALCRSHTTGRCSAGHVWRLSCSEGPMTRLGCSLLQPVLPRFHRNRRH
jgi:hypothetical protein